MGKMFAGESLTRPFFTPDKLAEFFKTSEGKEPTPEQRLYGFKLLKGYSEAVSEVTRQFINGVLPSSEENSLAKNQPEQNRTEQQNQ